MTGRIYLLLLVLGCGSLAAPASRAQSELDILRQEVEALRERLERLEARAAQSGGNIVEDAVSGEAGAGDLSPRDSLPPTDGEGLASAAPGSERDAVASLSASESGVDIGGALRFNYVHRDFSEASESRYGESGLDIFRLNVDGRIDNILIAAEYRFYSYMNTIRYGWLGYEFADDSQLQIGINQVPFGLLPYAAHNAWFGVPYYVGLADDYDMGLKYVRQDGPWNTQLAFYKNEELNDATDLGRYGFDLVQVGEDQSEEVNRFNARLAYTFGVDSGCETEMGVSAQRADIYNSVYDRRGDHWAAGLHMDSRCGRWNFQLQGARYSYDPPGPDTDSVRVGAFDSSYLIDDDAKLLVANVAYNWASPWPSIREIICYNDYSRLFKHNVGQDSRINTTGCGIGSGPLFAYVDYILANNMAFFGEGSMAGTGEDEWHSRFNINIGFYW